MDLSLILNYLNELSENNNREWYHAHKTDYREANAAFESFIQELIFKIGAFDGSVLQNDPKNLTFKLVRDTRFSHDKSPYNPAFRAHISSKGKLPVPVGYYLMIKPGNQSFLGGGLFADMFKDATTMVRDSIVENGEEWNALKFKSWYLEYPIKDEELINGEAFLEKAFEAFRIMKPFNDFLNRALADFRMPAR